MAQPPITQGGCKLCPHLMKLAFTLTKCAKNLSKVPSISLAIVI